MGFYVGRFKRKKPKWWYPCDYYTYHVRTGADEGNCTFADKTAFCATFAGSDPGWISHAGAIRGGVRYVQIVNTGSSLSASQFVTELAVAAGAHEC